jgi:hypothetical protein
MAQRIGRCIGGAHLGTCRGSRVQAARIIILALLAVLFADASNLGKADDVGMEMLSGSERGYVFTIKNGQGTKVIGDFSAELGQKIRLIGFGSMSGDQLRAGLKQSGRDTILDLGNHQQLRIVGVGAEVISSIQIELDRSGLVPTFVDDFNTLSLDLEDHVGEPRGTWRTNFGYGGPTSIHSRTLVNNAELQVYVDPLFAGTGKVSLNLNPFRVVSGNLEIVADRLSETVRPLAWMRSYSSGLITTKGSFSQTYGVFEMRAKMPRGKGLWPAFWLLPINGAWPPEIDILEILEDNPRKLYVSWHSNVGGQHTADSKPIDVADTTADFHTYSVEWNNDTVNWYFDDIQVASKATPQDFHQPMYVLANLAVGGNWPGSPDESTKFPATLSIDWIRAYERRSAQ